MCCERQWGGSGSGSRGALPLGQSDPWGGGVVGGLGGVGVWGRGGSWWVAFWVSGGRWGGGVIRVVGGVGGGCVCGGWFVGWFVVETGDMESDVLGRSVLGSSVDVQTPSVARSPSVGPSVPGGPGVGGVGGGDGPGVGVVERWQLVRVVTSGVGQSDPDVCVSYVREDEGVCVQAEGFVDDRGMVGFRVRRGVVEQATSRSWLGDGGGRVVEAGFDGFAGAVRRLGVVIVGEADGEVVWSGSRPGEIARSVESRVGESESVIRVASGE